MKIHANKILIGFLLMAVFHSAMAEVTTLSIVTDSTWKSLDFDNDGWASENYDDTWWQAAREDNSWATIEPGKMIWYPGTVRGKPDIAYFRNVFDIDGIEILNGKMYVGTEGDGTIYLFINGNSIEKITEANNLYPAEIDITSYLKPGKNVIAAKVDILPGNTHLWALTGTIRYNKVASGQPIN